MTKIEKVTVNGKDLNRETARQSQDWPWEKTSFIQILRGSVTIEDENGNRFPIKGATHASFYWKQDKEMNLEIGFGKEYCDSKDLGFKI